MAQSSKIVSQRKEENTHVDGSPSSPCQSFVVLLLLLHQLEVELPLLGKAPTTRKLNQDNKYPHLKYVTIREVLGGTLLVVVGIPLGHANYAK